MLKEPGQLRSSKDLSRSTNFCMSDQDKNPQQGHIRWEKVILKMRHLSEKQGKRIQHVPYNELDEAGSLPFPVLGISLKDQHNISESTYPCLCHRFFFIHHLKHWDRQRWWCELILRECENRPVDRWYTYRQTSILKLVSTWQWPRWWEPV